MLEIIVLLRVAMMRVALLLVGLLGITAGRDQTKAQRSNRL
jgi:hypothetical protein